MIEGELQIPYGEIAQEERQRMQQIQILKNDLTREVYLYERRMGIETELSHEAFRGFAGHQVVELLDQNEPEVA